MPFVQSDMRPAAERLSGKIETEQLVGLYRNMLISRFIDDEEIRLRKKNEVYFQISGAGHEAIGVATAFTMRPAYDWFYPYYRDRSLCLQLGMTPLEMLRSAVGASEDPNSHARQMPSHWGHKALNIVSSSSPTGTQYNQAVGCAEAGQYIAAHALPGLPAHADEVVYVSSGEGATSEGEFWEMINVAANKKLPVLIMVEDNGYAISVPSEVTTAGADVAQCFSGVPGLTIMKCDGTDLLQSLDVCEAAVAHMRAGNGPVLLHAKVTRPYSHSLSDDHAYYRPKRELEEEAENDCIKKVETYFLETGILTESQIEDLHKQCREEVAEASRQALASRKPEPGECMTHLYSDAEPEGTTEAATGGEVLALGQAVNRTMMQEMGRDPRIVVFGEDVADCSREDALGECKGKGGVFKITYGLQTKHGGERVFNSPLAEAMIAGRAIGMATRGLKPVVEIQFFDYIWPAFMQLRNEWATMRYRSAGDFTAPAVVRVPIGGYLRGGAIYHSQTGESIFVLSPGIKIAYPSNAADAMGLLRAAIRMDDPVLFLEHKHLYYQGYNRAADPGPDYIVPFGKAAIKRPGKDVTVVCWGALVQKSLEAANQAQQKLGIEVEVIDLRTLVPFDKETVYASIRKTGKLIVAHEEQKTNGFGAEIAAQAMEECFEWLDSPVRRVTSKDCWIAYSPILEEALLPQTSDVYQAIEEIAAY